MAAVSGRVLDNMDAACQFAAGEAQRRAPVLTGAMRAGVDYEVTVKEHVVEGRVGVREKDAFYAHFPELGTRLAPAQPFLRPAVYGNARRIAALIRGGR